MSPAEILRTGRFENPREYLIREIEWRMFPRDEALKASQYVIGSIQDDLDEIQDWLDEYNAGRFWKYFDGGEDSSTHTAKLGLVFNSDDHSLAFKMRWL